MMISKPQLLILNTAYYFKFKLKVLLNKEILLLVTEKKPLLLRVLVHLHMHLSSPGSKSCIYDISMYKTSRYGLSSKL